MKIDKITVRDYGPIKKFTLTPARFVCIFGRNESGKTTIVEALTNIIFRKNPRTLRYGKPADVQVEITVDDRRITLPSRKAYSQFPVGDLAHLMYVQAADSMIFEKDAGAHFWDSLKSLLGHMGEGVSFSKLAAKLFDAVGLTARRGEWKEEKQHLIEQETRRQQELKKYITHTGGIEKKEQELHELIARQQAHQRVLDAIEKMKKFTTYRQLASRYNEFTDLSSRLQTYDRYKYEYLDTWQECEAGRTSQQRDGRKLEITEQEMNGLKQEISALEEQEQRVEDEGLRTCIVRAEEEVRIPRLLYPAIICAAAAFLAALSFALRVFTSPALVLLGLSVLFFVFTVYRRHIMQALMTEKERWLGKARNVFPDAASLAEVAQRIDALRDLKLRKETLMKEKARLKEDLAQTLKEHSYDRTLAELREKTGCAEIADLKKKINEKRIVEKDVSVLHAQLADMLHEEDETQWKRMIQQRHQEEPQGDIDIAEEESVRTEVAQIQKNIDELKSDISIFKETYKEKFAVDSEYDAFVEYQTLSDALRTYELERKAALAARDILKQMSIEYDRLLESIITGDDSLSDYFRTVSGRYEAVEVKKHDFHVRDGSGNVYDVNDLSSGARDQLLLCFRIAALQRSYPGGSFLILDDAFIFADWARRSRLAALLNEYIDLGNQVIYFTSDDHTRDILAEHGAEIVNI